MNRFDFSAALLRMNNARRYIFETDFCPQYNIYRDWLKHPLVLLSIAAAGATAFGAFVAPQGFAAAGACATIASVGIAWPKIVMMLVSAEMVPLQKRVREGEPTSFALKVMNRWPWPVWGLRAQVIIPSERHELALAAIGPAIESEFRWTIVPRRRGEFPTGEVWLVTGFPFGLYESRKRVELRSRTLVHSETRLLESPPPGTGDRSIRADLVVRDGGRDGDFSGTRELRRGDSMRDLHWALTARYERPIVTERETHVASPIRVYLDCASAIETDGSDSELVEWMIRFGASICEAAAARTSAAELVIGQDVYRPRRGEHGAWNWPDALARRDCANEHSFELSRMSDTDLFITTERSSNTTPHSLRGRTIVLRTGDDLPEPHGWLVLERSDSRWESFLESWERRCRHVACFSH